MNLHLLCVTKLAFSQETKFERKQKWQVSINYARLFNYRYAKLPDYLLVDPINHPINHQLSHLDTGNIAIYSNLIGVMIQRRIWKFINIQTGATQSRRGFLGAYLKRNKFDNNGNFIGTYNEFQITPKKIISIPIILNFYFSVKNKLQLQFGIGKEIISLVLKEKVYYPTTLGKSSSGFFGYDWDKNRKLKKGTLINSQYGNGQSSYNFLAVGIGYKLNSRLLLSINGNYSVSPKYYNLDYDGGGAYSYLRFDYDVKPYYFGFGSSVSYCF